MDDLRYGILAYIDKKIGPNKQLYFPIEKVYQAAKNDYADEDIQNSFSALIENGYLENTEGGCRITQKGYIYKISSEIMGELYEKNIQELNDKKEELEKKLNKAIGYQWMGIAFAFIVALIILLAG